MPVGTPRASSASTLVIGTADAVGGFARVADAVVDACATDPHAWHSLQRPTHTGVVQPHSPHRYVALVFAMIARLDGDGDNSGFLRNRRRRRKLSGPLTSVLVMSENTPDHSGPPTAEFIDADLSGARLERVNLSNATLHRVRLHDAHLSRVDFSGTTIRGAAFYNVTMKGVEFYKVDVSGEVIEFVINGVDVAPLVEAELNRRDPERATIRSKDAAGIRAAWAMLERRWAQTVEHARTLPPERSHASVNGEWSFVQTLRHLNFASAAWVGRAVLGEPSPWHPLDLPWDEAPGWDEIPWDRDVQPSLEEVLAVRAERQAMVRGVIEALTDQQLAGSVTRAEPGWPQLEDFPVIDALSTVLNEEWEHRLYAERDLALLEKEN